MTRVYVCAPHRLRETNEMIASAIEAAGNIVYLPGHICRREDKARDDRGIRRKCIRVIDDADTLVTYLDDYGMDSAWELGYAEKAGKQIVGLSLDKYQLSAPKAPSPKTIWEHWMHGWAQHTIVKDLPGLLSEIRDKKVYISAPIRRCSDLARLQDELKSRCGRLYMPRDIIGGDILSRPKETWLIARRRCVEAIDDADTLVTYLDDYGMDSAWELGYAEKAGKQIVGLSLDKYQLGAPKALSPKTIWEHWMHGWTERTIVHGMDALMGVLRNAECFKIPVVCPIIEREGQDGSTEILLQMRTNPRDKQYYGIMEVPGGKIRHSETIVDAVRREVREECGLIVEPVVNGPSYLYQTQGSTASLFEPFALAEEVGNHSYLGIFIRCRVVGASPHPTAEGADQKWVSTGTLKRLANEKRLLPISAPGLIKYIEQKER